MKKHQLLLISDNDFFKKAIAEQIENSPDYEKVLFTEHDKAEESLATFNFDGLLVDTDSNNFVGKLFLENQSKPQVFFVSNKGRSSNSSFLDVKDENNFSRLVIYRPFKLEVLLNVLKTSFNQYEKGVGSIIKIGAFCLDQGQKQLTSNNQNITKLTEKEVDILRYLIKNKNKTINKESLLEQVWGYNSEINTHTLETHIYRLRQKIGDMAKYLITDDKGYSITIDDEQC